MIILGYSGFSRDSHTPGRACRHATVNAGFEGLFEFRESAAPLTMFPLSYFGHDASAALIADGKLVACAAEERFTRTKHSLNLAGNTLLPKNAIEYCLREAGILIRDVDVVAHYCDFTEDSVSRRLELLRGSLQVEDAERLRQSYTDTFLSLLSGESVLSQFERMTGAQPKRFLPVAHHEAHAASTFFCSGFDTAVILTIDGSGELESSLLALGRGSRIEELHRTLLPTSLGTLYLVISVHLGFRSLGDEYKVMGLAAYGKPERYRRFFDSLVALGNNGEYYTPMLARQELKELLESRLGAPRRPEEAVEERHADIAASLQEALDRTVLHTLRHAASATEAKYLCLAGGVALNCSMNGALEQLCTLAINRPKTGGRRQGVWRMCIWDPPTARKRSFAHCAATLMPCTGCPKPIFRGKSRPGWPKARWRAGSRDEWSSDPGRWETEAFWLIPAIRR
jgi:predicted NodU family carbamoyl transferase